MAKDTKLDIEAAASLDTGEESTKPRSYRLHILLILIAVVLAEATLLFFILPKPGETAAILSNLPTEQIIDGEIIPVSPAPVPGEHPKETYAEKPLGDKFTVQNTRPGPEQAIDSFTVTVIVNVLEKDATKYDTLFEKKKFAIRQAVETVLQASTLDERNQVGYSTIKMRIMKEINNVLGVPYVRSVICNGGKTETI